MYCHAHPHKVARRKCRHCKKPLCPRCQIIIDGIIFCSSSCRWSYIFSQPRQFPSFSKIAVELKTKTAFLASKLIILHQRLKPVYQKLKPILSLLDRELCYWEERLSWELKASQESLKIFWIDEKEGLRRNFARLQKFLAFIYPYILRASKAVLRGAIYCLKTLWALSKKLAVSLYYLTCLTGNALARVLGDFVPRLAKRILNVIYEYIKDNYLKYKDYDDRLKKQWWARVFARALMVTLVILVFSLSRSVMRAHRIYEDLMSNNHLSLKYLPRPENAAVSRNEASSSLSKTRQASLGVKIQPIPSLIRPSLPDIQRVSTREKVISLTFDGGDEANITQNILDALKHKGIRTTIFLTGNYMKKYPHYVRRMVKEGHEIGNHTMTHPHLTTYARNRRHDLLPSISKRYFQKELISTNETFKSIVGRDLWPYWRAPYGEQNPTLRAWAEELGYQHISWTVDYENRESMDSVDWVADKDSRLYRSSEEIKNRLISFGEHNSRGAKGGIVLMHLGTQRKDDRVHERLEEIIDAFQQKGYRLVTVSELLKTDTHIRTALKKSSTETP